MTTNEEIIGNWLLDHNLLHVIRNWLKMRGWWPGRWAQAQEYKRSRNNNEANKEDKE